LKPYFVSSLRIDFNSRQRFAVVLGYAIFSPLNASRTIWETINRAFSLSSAGTTYQGAIRACRVQASLISRHVILPVFPLVNVSEAKFPVLVGLINALEESLSLFFLRKVEEYFDGPRSVAI
jgi:hypothetical protein